MTVEYGYCQSELPWGAFSPIPISRDVVTRICQGIKAIGGTWVRMGNSVGTLDDLDYAINAATGAGLKVLLVIQGNQLQGYTGGAASFGEQCKMLATRYGPSGTNQVAMYELWNESNLVLLNPPQVAMAGYVEYLKTGHTAIHDVHPSATVMPCGPIPGPTTWFGWEFNPFDWYTGLYAAGAKDFMDAIAVHLYADVFPTPQMTQWKYITDIRDLMVAQGDSGKKVLVTEVGTSNPGPGITTPVVERDWLKAMVDGILSYTWMGPFFIYNFESSSPDLTDSTQNYGCVSHVDLIPKPLKYAYCQSIAGITGNPLDIVPPSAPTNLRVTSGGLASWSPSTDDVGVTVYRIYDTATGSMLCHTPSIGQTSMQIPGLRPGAPYTVYATALDAAGNESAHSGTAPFTTDAPPGSQEQVTVNFSLSPSTPPDFVAIGLGIHVASGSALPNAATSRGHYYTIAPYVRDAQSPDHFCEITCDAPSPSSDRYAMAGVRSNPEGTQGVFGFISGGGKVDAAKIITVDAGVATIRNARNAPPYVPGQKLRITPLGNTYVLERYVNGVATELGSWIDTGNVYAGATNLRPSIAYLHKYINGHYYPPNGITTFTAIDLRPITPSGTGGSDAWTYAIVKDISMTIATQLWEISL